MGDAVLDPFAGSCVTGMVAERLRRKWTCVELSESYLSGAVGRFQGQAAGSTKTKEKTVQYTINPPCALPIDEAVTPLMDDGGRARPVAATPRVKTVTQRMMTDFQARIV